jgi:hypothetical protein
VRIAVAASNQPRSKAANPAAREGAGQGDAEDDADRTRSLDLKPP